MSAIRAICPACVSPVDLQPADVLLLTRPDATAPGTYLYFCPACEQVAVRPASQADITLLIAAGVRAGQPTASPSGSHSPSEARPFTRDDLLDFHLLLATEDWLTTLLTGPERPAP